MSFESFNSFSAHKRASQRADYADGLRKDAMPSRRDRGGVSFLNAADREKWHLKVISDRDNAVGKMK